MSVRSVCPVCNASLTTGATNADEIVPCPGCGQNIQLPADNPFEFAPPTETSDQSQDDVEPRRTRRRSSRDHGTRDRREPVRGSLLWLWVLLGTGALGAVVGGAVIFFVNRNDKPELARPEPPPAPIADH